MARSLRLALALAGALAPACVSVPAPAPLPFAVDDDQLRDAKAKREIEDAVEAMQKDPDLHVLLVGHADEDNTDEYNRELSRRRALHVRERILELAPELDDRIRIEARSEWDAMDQRDSDVAKTRNRRVELHFHYPRRCEPELRQ